jgi:predicted nucleic-acid-binding Zn-ribbon protein
MYVIYCRDCGKENADMLNASWEKCEKCGSTNIWHGSKFFDEGATGVKLLEPMADKVKRAESV